MLAKAQKNVSNKPLYLYLTPVELAHGSMCPISVDLLCPSMKARMDVLTKSFCVVNAILMVDVKYDDDSC